MVAPMSLRGDIEVVIDALRDALSALRSLDEWRKS